MRLQKYSLWLLLVSCSFISCTSNAQPATDLTVGEFEKGIKQLNVQVLDVRTFGEYQSGHLKDALLADWTNQEQFVERAQSLDKSKPVYTYCLSGVRSGAAAEWLRENGYIAYNLDGGIAAWKRALEEAAIVQQMALTEYQSLIPNDKIVLVDVGFIW